MVESSNKAFVEIIRQADDPGYIAALTRAHRYRNRCADGIAFTKLFRRHLIGIRGEEAFASAFSVEPNYYDLPGGDGGVDFRIHLLMREEFRQFTVDVKTSKIAETLRVKVDGATADIFVLAFYDEDEDEAQIIGWQWRQIVIQSPIVDKMFICSELRPISDLLSRSLYHTHVGDPSSHLN